MRFSRAGGDGTYRVVVHRRGGVDDAVASVEGGAEAGPVEQVHLQHREALRRAVERPQVRVPGVICADRHNTNLLVSSVPRSIQRYDLVRGAAGGSSGGPRPRELGILAQESHDKFYI
jgi:hypothetical protein